MPVIVGVSILVVFTVIVVSIDCVVLGTVVSVGDAVPTVVGDPEPNAKEEAEYI